MGVRNITPVMKRLQSYKHLLAQELIAVNLYTAVHVILVNTPDLLIQKQAYSSGPIAKKKNHKSVILIQVSLYTRDAS